MRAWLARNWDLLAPYLSLAATVVMPWSFIVTDNGAIQGLLFVAGFLAPLPLAALAVARTLYHGLGARRLVWLAPFCIPWLCAIVYLLYVAVTGTSI